MDAMAYAVAGCLKTDLHYGLQDTGQYSLIRSLRPSGSGFDDHDILYWLGAFIYAERSIDEPWKDKKLSSTSFLIEQGLDVNGIDEAGMTTLMSLILKVECEENYAEIFPRMVHLLCLLNADVSIRTPKYGLQALHLLLVKKWSAKFAPLLMEIAYILIHVGGADVSACTYNGLSVSYLALGRGWSQEWNHVLNRCGYNLDDVYMNDLKRERKYQKIGDGDSTAVDTDDILEPLGTTVIRRTNVTGDRLID